MLDSAKDIFSEKGYHDTSVEDIIQRAGIARGTFYLYFKNKRDLFDRLLDELLKNIRAQIRPIELTPDGPAPIAQIRANFRRVLDLLLQDVELTRIVLLHALGLDKDFDQKLLDFDERIAETLARSLELGIEMGLVRPCEPLVVAHCVMGCIKQVVRRLTTQPQRRPLPGLDKLVDEVLAFGLNGTYAGPKGDPT